MASSRYLANTSRVQVYLAMTNLLIKRKVFLHVRLTIIIAIFVVFSSGLFSGLPRTPPIIAYRSNLYFDPHIVDKLNLD